VRKRKRASKSILRCETAYGEEEGRMEIWGNEILRMERPVLPKYGPTMADLVEPKGNVVRVKRWL
jgi:hypothetical protein